MAFREPALEDEVPPFVIPSLTQPFQERLPLVGGWGSRPQVADPVDLARRLRLGGKRCHEEGEGEGDEKPVRRRVIGASGVHGRVRGFYAPPAGEGKPIVLMHVCTSVEQISRSTNPDLMTSHPSVGSREWLNTPPPMRRLLRRKPPPIVQLRGRGIRMPDGALDVLDLSPFAKPM